MLNFSQYHTRELLGTGLFGLPFELHAFVLDLYRYLILLLLGMRIFSATLVGD